MSSYTYLLLPSLKNIFSLFIVIVTAVFFFPLDTTASSKQLYPDISLLAGDDFTEVLSEDTYSSWLQFSPQLEFALYQNYSSEFENIEHCPFPFWICEFSSPARQKYYWKKETLLTVQRAPVEIFVDDLNKRVYSAPQDARFELLDSNKVSAFNLGKNGRELNKEKSVEILTDSLSTFLTQKRGDTDAVPLRLAVNILPASVQSSDAQALGITTLIGEGRSDFSGSSSDRIFNIRHALKNFQGRLLPPQGELSFVEILGEVDEEHGYRPELVIRDNKTEPEYGGGICQVSTTLFRAAIYSGMEITARRNHSYPVKYYKPIGFDATVYVPRPDLKFINNTSEHVLIQANIEKTDLVFRFYGNSDGRSVEVDGPYVTEKSDDGSLKTIFTQRVFTESGEVLFQEDFRSNYDSPDNYPKPEDIDLSKKPKDWSNKQWKKYKKQIEGN